jgi:hypothetical protein
MSKPPECLRIWHLLLLISFVETGYSHASQVEKKMDVHIGYDCLPMRAMSE